MIKHLERRKREKNICAILSPVGYRNRKRAIIERVKRKEERMRKVSAAARKRKNDRIAALQSRTNKT